MTEPSRRDKKEQRTVLAVPSVALRKEYLVVSIPGSNGNIKRTEAQSTKEGSGVTDGRLVIFREEFNKMENVEWYVDGVLPKMPCLAELFGDPGVGKSTLCAYLTGCFTDGWPFPGTDSRLPDSHPVFWINSDGKFQSLAERMRDFGVNTNYVAGPSCHSKLGHLRAPTMKDADLTTIVQGIRACVDVFGELPRLVILDGLSRFHGGDENSAKVANDCMGYLQQICQSAQCPMILVHHASKPSNVIGAYSAQHRARGSSAWVANVEIAWMLEQYQDKERRKLTVVKSNLAPEPEPIVFRIKDGTIDFEGFIPTRRKGKEDIAADLLTVALRDGPKPKDELLTQLSEQHGISNATAYNARARLNLEGYTESGITYWRFPPLSKFETDTLEPTQSLELVES